MTESCVPPGFRFHPTEEELVGYYLKRKISSLKIDLDLITDIDLYNMEPWDIQDRCKLLGNEEQKEWYFFSHKDKKYPTGTRTNRATAHGFWKATGRDKAVVSSRNRSSIIGMRKTLVFYRGRAPNGRKTDWIIHEYRLQTSQHAPPQEEGWVVCRAFKKPIPNERPAGFDPYSHSHTGVQRPDCTTPDYVLQNQDLYFQQSILSTLPEEMDNVEGQLYPQLLDPTAILDGLPMNQAAATSNHQRCNLPRIEGYYDLDSDQWKALNSLLTAPEPASCSTNSDHQASNCLPALNPRELASSAHQNHGYYQHHAF